jgi:hypothetical protein
MQADFYSVYDSKSRCNACMVRRSSAGFQKIHAYAANRSQDTFYNTDGTIVVSVTGGPSKEGENPDAYSVVYARFLPGLAEKTIISLNRQKVVCQ